MTVENALRILYQIILGLSVLSENKIVHRDMKPANIFIHKNVYKIGDFGLARELIDKLGVFQTGYGTSLYMAPEFYNDDALTAKVDIWAVGCMFHQMLFGTLAFSGEDQNQIGIAVMNGYKGPPRELDPIVEEVLIGCLAVKPEERFAIGELRLHKAFDFCRHEYVSELDSKLKKSYFHQVSDKIPESNIQSNAAQEQRRLDLENQKSFIIENLMRYWEVSRFYYTNALWLNENCSGFQLLKFLLAKRGVQKLSTILYFLNQRKPTQLPNDKELTLSCSHEAWEHFMDSPDSKSLRDKIIFDHSEATEFFQIINNETQSVYGGHVDFINDDMKSLISRGDLSDCLNVVVKDLMDQDTINGQVVGPNLDKCWDFCILDKFEANEYDQERYNLADSRKEVQAFT
jgi:serine/threonine protein kinase